MQHPTHKSIWSSIFYWHRHDLRSTSSAQQLQRYGRDLCPKLYQAHLSAHLFTCASVHEWYKDISAEVYFEVGSADVYSCLVKSYIYWGQVVQPLTVGQKKKRVPPVFFVRVWQGGSYRSVRDWLHFPVWVCVSEYVRMCERVQWSVSGAATCVFALSALIEGAWSHISGCHVLQRNAFNVSHSVQYKREGWHSCIENTTFKNPQAPLITLTPKECACASVSATVYAHARRESAPVYRTGALVIQTIFLSVPISTIQTLPGMFSRGNVLHMMQTQCMLLGMSIKLGKCSWTWHVNDTFVLYWHSA